MHDIIAQGLNSKSCPMANDNFGLERCKNAVPFYVGQSVAVVRKLTVKSISDGSIRIEGARAKVSRQYLFLRPMLGTNLDHGLSQLFKM